MNLRHKPRVIPGIRLEQFEISPPSVRMVYVLRRHPDEPETSASARFRPASFVSSDVCTPITFMCRAICMEAHVCRWVPVYLLLWVRVTECDLLNSPRTGA